MSTWRLPHLERDEHPRVDAAMHLFWAVCAATVLVFILLAALDVINPAEAIAFTVVSLALAVLWLGHSWLGLWRDEKRR